MGMREDTTSLKIPMELSETVNRRKDNAMAKKRGGGKPNNNLHNATQKVKD